MNVDTPGGHMTRFGVLTALAIAGALSPVTGAPQVGQLPRAKVRSIQHIKDNL
jgi:hypothetical protein